MESLLVCIALPKMTCWKSPGSNFDWAIAPLAAIAPSSFAVKSRNAPPYSPIAVRFPATMTMSIMSPPKNHDYDTCYTFDFMKDFLATLGERVLVCDGAMGTMLYSK